MRPLPWSHTGLSDFVNCPRAFAEKRVYKTVKEERGEEAIWGERVHKHFEERLVDGVVLPDELDRHEEFLARLEAEPGVLTVEQKIALDIRAQPCEFFGRDVWYRGVIDAKKVNGAYAHVVDHKTGKMKSCFKQLKGFALHTFAAHPEVQTVRAEYYWTQMLVTTGETYTRDMVPDLWKTFSPDLKQYAQAFKEEVWQPRQSGLCNGWCPVTTCEFWKPKRRRG